jgi:multidrug efflux system membrane fusion protein
MRRSARSRASIVLAASLAGCGGGADSASRAPAPVPVVVAKAEVRTVPVTVRAIGNVEAVARVDVKARIAGELRSVHFREGEEVRRGQLLFSIDARPFQVALAEADARLARDRALLQKADDDVRRFSGLVEQEYVTREQFDSARSQAASLAATVRADEAAVEGARLDLDYATIRAPIPGRAGAVLVQPGNLVKANDDRPLVTLLQTRPVWVSFAVPESRLAEIRARAGAGPLAVRAHERGGEAAARTGRLDFVDNAVDPTSGTIRLKAVFPNEDGALWPGQFLEVELKLSDEANAVVVPSPAVQTGQNGTFVFVVKDDGTPEARPVVVSRAVGEDTVLTSGVSGGETVIVDGQLRVVPGAKVEPRARPAAPPGPAS